tara:strand:- start:480 stop:1496 length:1017 start_codon:yes stop_codon:yes gene_type:complete
MKILLFFIVFFLINFCNSKIAIEPKILFEKNKRTFIIGDTLNFKVLNNEKYDSINFFLDKTRIKIPYFVNNIVLGDKKITAKIFIDKKIKSTTENIRILAKYKPKLYSYRILNEYPHDTKAYTQGLEFNNDTLIESTGLINKSSIRKINYKNGEKYQIKLINSDFFGEGLTILNDTIYQLTWKNNLGIVYKNNFEIIRTFNYIKSKEGWGLCNDGEFLYKSDGSSKIWKIDRKNFNEMSFIQVTTDKTILKKINELEWVNGKIYANTYQFNKDVVLIINPLSGHVEGVIDFSGLKSKVDQIPSLNVFNGIAYHKKRNTFFVTGKNWSKVFEVSIHEKD